MDGWMGPESTKNPPGSAESNVKVHVKVNNQTQDELINDHQLTAK